jgi:trans-2,3-dihydro-3-hydroxyanthranilate isomerase
MKKECIFIDVFTDTPYTGNQLAVFPDAEDVSPKQMLSLAREINYSEVTFIIKSKDTEADFDIRIFTPGQEIPFAGHPTLGTAYTIAHMLNLWPTENGVLRLRTMAGVIPVEFKGSIVWMKQNSPLFFNQHTDKAAIASMVGLTEQDVPDNLPIEEVSTGNKILILPVKSLTSIRKAFGNPILLKKFHEDTHCLAPYLFTTETIEKGTQIHSRFFAPHFGILEDPATGSAAGPLTAYLLKYNLFGKKLELINEQGFEINRPSKIYMKGSLEHNEYNVFIGGLCTYVGRGKYTL